MRDMCLNSADQEHRNPVSREFRSQKMIVDLVSQFGASTIEWWNDATWESLAVQALWRVCRNGVHGVERSPQAPQAAVRYRDTLLDATREDSDALVNEVLIRYCAAFADQGLSQWRLPDRDLGFYGAFCELYRDSSGPQNDWLRNLGHPGSRSVSAFPMRNEYL